jgi:hypothetical protein
MEVSLRVVLLVIKMGCFAACSPFFAKLINYLMIFYLNLYSIFFILSVSPSMLTFSNENLYVALAEGIPVV